jgi:LmbE family N-acetylglucosaminyl deacetylase
MSDGRVCIVVAHPDDEVLWFGGGLLALEQASTDVTVVCLTNARHPVRSREFEELCRRVSARSLMLDYPDGGRAMFPEFPVELSPLLSDAGVEPAGLEFVITHSPLGNERAHPQHGQCWAAVRAWATLEGVPLGFFSEGEVLGLRAGAPRQIAPGVRLRVARLRASQTAVAVARSLRSRPFDLEAHHMALLRARAHRARFGDICGLIEIDVDVARKTELMEAYPSQLDGLRAYDTYAAGREYLYLNGSDTVVSATGAFACPRS